jgi:predicted porin
VVDYLLLQSNANDDFLTLVIFQRTSVWFNTFNFPKTEVGSEKFRAPVQTLENLEMKKTLVAIAALAAFGAQAQSSVTISGVLDAGYRSVNAPLSGDTKGAFQNGTATSAIFIRGTEDLGSGLSASFQYEINPDFVGGAGFSGSVLEGTAAGTDNKVRTSNGANGNNFIGLTSKSLGGVKVGRLNTSTLAAWGTGSVFGTAVGSGYASNGNVFTTASSSLANYFQSAPTRFNNAVEYTSPAIAGFTARVLYVPQVNNPTADGGENNATVATMPGTNRQGVTDIGLAYNQGPLNVQFAQQDAKQGNAINALVNTGTAAADANSKYKLTTLAANYTIGATKIYAAMWTEKNTLSTPHNSVDSAGNMIGVKHTMGKIDLMASMGKRNNKNAAQAAAAGGALTDKDVSVTGLGVDYNFSKRTAAWVRMESRDANTNVTAETSAAGVTKTTAVGIRHNF